MGSLIRPLMPRPIANREETGHIIELSEPETIRLQLLDSISNFPSLFRFDLRPIGKISNFPNPFGCN